MLPLKLCPHHWREWQSYQVPTCPSELGPFHGSNAVLLPCYFDIRAHVLHVDA